MADHNNKGKSLLSRSLSFISQLWNSSKANNSNEEPKKQQGETVPSDNVVSMEGGLRVTVGKNHSLEFYSTLNPARLFVIRGTMAGPMGKFSKHIPPQSKVTSVTVPVKLLDNNLTAIRAALTCPSEAKVNELSADLVRAGKGIQPDGRQVISVLFIHDSQEFQLTFEIDSNVQIEEFEEIADTRPVFQTVPAVAQMAAFLKATTSKRRNAFNVLKSLRLMSSPELQSDLDRLLYLHEEGLTVEATPIQELARVFQESGKKISEQVLLAFSILIEQTVGHINVNELTENDTIHLNPASLALVSDHFGLRFSEDIWNKLSISKDLSYERLKESLSSPRYKDIPRRLSSEYDNRSSLDILEQLATDSSNDKVADFAAAMRARYGNGALAITDQQMGLWTLFSASGRNYHINTLAAMCMFVDVGLGIIEAEATTSDGRGYSLEASPYAMLVVSSAFDVDLTCLSVDLPECGKSSKELEFFTNLISCSRVGILARFVRVDDGSKTWVWIRSSEIAKKAFTAPEQEFDSIILGIFPKIGQLSEIDLADMCDSGRDFVISFQSDFDKSILWRSRSRIPEKSYMLDKTGERRTNFSFIEGFCAYHFSRSVIGSIETINDEDLLGKDNILAVYLDNRENNHYRYLKHVNSLEDLQPKGQDENFAWNHQIVKELDVSHLSYDICEPSLEELLGGEAQRISSRNSRCLQWLNSAVWQIFTKLFQYKPLTTGNNLAELLHKRYWNSHGCVLVSGMMDVRTQDTVGKLLLGQSKTSLELKVSAPLVRDYSDNKQTELLALLLLFAISHYDNIPEFDGYFKLIDDVCFRNLIFDRVLSLLHSNKAENQIMACHIIASSDVISDSHFRFSSQFELNGMLESTQDAAVGTAITEALVRINLMEKMSLPSLIKIGELSSGEKANDIPEVRNIVGVEPQLIKNLAQETDRWLHDLKKEDPERFSSLPLVNESGEIDKERLAAFVERVAALNQASLNASGDLPRRYFAIVPNHILEDTRFAFLECWKLLAASKNVTLKELVDQGDPSDLMLDYRFFVEDHGEEISLKLGHVPYFGGSETPIRIYRLRPGEALGPLRRAVGVSFTEEKFEESELFVKLLSDYFNSSDRNPRILRLHSAGGVNLEQIENTLSSFETARMIDLRSVEVFTAQHIRFYSGLRDLTFTVEQMGGTKEDQEALRALLAIVTGQRKPVQDPQEKPYTQASPATTDIPSEDKKTIEKSPTEDKSDSAEISDNDAYNMSVEDILGSDEQKSQNSFAESNEELKELMSMAQIAGKALDLPDDLQHQVVNIFISASRNAVYPPK